MNRQITVGEPNSNRKFIISAHTASCVGNRTEWVISFTKERKFVAKNQWKKSNQGDELADGNLLLLNFEGRPVSDAPAVEAPVYPSFRRQP